MHLFSAIYSFLKIKICKDRAILVIANAMSLCPSIPYDYGLETLRKRVNDLQRQRYLLRTYCKWRNMFLKIFFFEFDGEVKQQKSGTAICTKFKPPFACIFMDEIETEFFKSEELQPFL